MVAHALPSNQSQELEALDPHQHARHLVRLVQCPRCSKLFTAPVTLPCGHTICQQCLPGPQLRRNISYPDTLDHQLGITCPICAQESSTAECNVDVAFSKLMENLKDELLNHASLYKESPTLLEEITAGNDDAPVLSRLERLTIGRCATLQGGRLASTFAMADQGLLLYSSDVSYRSQSSGGDDFQDLDSALLSRLREIIRRELDCYVCYNTMLEPTTTSCGHTFCRHCLVRVMDHSSICPVCRRELHISASLEGQSSNGGLVSLLNGFCPDLVSARKLAFSEEERLADDRLNTPLFVCTLSLPSMPTFLHIFEPRYRLMMRRCMDTNRRFGMVMFNRPLVPQGDLGATKFLEYGTLLEIVHMEFLPDGRSYVETRGVSRFRVVEYGMQDGYDVGRVERVDDVSLTQEKRLEAMEISAAQMSAAEYNARNARAPLMNANYPEIMPTLDIFHKCSEYVMAMRASSAPWLSARIVNLYGDCPQDPAVFPYWFASVLPIANEEKYALLKTTSVRERLKIVYGWITRIEGNRRSSGASCSIQ